MKWGSIKSHLNNKNTRAGSIGAKAESHAAVILLFKVSQMSGFMIFLSHTVIKMKSGTFLHAKKKITTNSYECFMQASLILMTFEHRRSAKKRREFCYVILMALRCYCIMFQMDVCVCDTAIFFFLPTQMEITWGYVCWLNL